MQQAQLVAAAAAAHLQPRAEVSVLVNIQLQHFDAIAQLASHLQFMKWQIYLNKPETSLFCVAAVHNKHASTARRHAHKAAV
jgi:hypothetical protein